MLQGSDEWRQARCGSIGASDVPRVVRKINSGKAYSADRASLMAEKLIERTTGKPYEKYKSAAMLQGTAREPEARLMYAILKGLGLDEIEQIGLVVHPKIAGAHASPDGLVGDKGLVEIKCPEPAAHLDTLDHETVSQDYYAQMSWQLGCTGRQWCDYCSYNPDYPTAMSIWIKRVNRDESYIRELEREVERFIRELEAKIERLTQRYGRLAA